MSCSGLAAGSAALLLTGMAFAAGTLFRRWIVPVEHNGAYYTQKAYSEVKRFTVDDFSGHIRCSPEAEF